MKKLLLLTACIFASTLASNAYVDNQYMTTEQYIVNTGFSKEVARLIQFQTKDPYAPLPEKKDMRPIQYKILNYIDPSSYGDYQFPRNNTKYFSSWEDL